MQGSSTMAPVAASERMTHLDVLRGLALLGIALMNVEYFSAPLSDVGEGIGPTLTGLDRAADAFVYVFVRSKFWTLFSLLFGMGFAVMLGRAQAAGRAFLPLYLRRTVGLLVIGVLHAWLVWAGDILVSYALTAFVLLLCFRDTPVPRLWKWGALVYALPMALMLLAALAMGLGGGGQAAAAGAGEAAGETLRAAEIAAYSGGSFAEASAVRLRYLVHSLGTDVFLIPMVLGMFLVGAWLVRSGAMQRPGEHRRLFARLAWIGGATGFALTFASLALDANPGASDAPSARAMLAMALHLMGAPLVALAYIGVVVLALQRGAGLLRGLAPVGRMALTNYLMQSLIGTWLFYGYGLGLWGEVSRAWQVVGVVAVFALQWWLSHWWLARFRYGPAEWLWRAFTYWRWPAMRQAAPAPLAAR